MIELRLRSQKGEEEARELTAITLKKLPYFSTFAVFPAKGKLSQKHIRYKRNEVFQLRTVKGRNLVLSIRMYKACLQQCAIY